jgi:hypothetical protein
LRDVGWGGGAEREVGLHFLLLVPEYTIGGGCSGVGWEEDGQLQRQNEIQGPSLRLRMTT